LHGDLDGAINVSSPNPRPQRDFMRILRQACGVRIGLPATRWMLEIGAWMLSTETELILEEPSGSSATAARRGFEFQYPFWRAAARDLVTNEQSPGAVASPA
jgi:NAD dependent epimerase/dehydratase family enzyme